MDLLLTLDDANEMADAIEYRQGHFENEDLRTSILVVVLNYGSKYTAVSCINGEWQGIKADLMPRDGVPHCPNGHVLVEVDGGKQLGLVDAPAFGGGA